MALSMPIVYAQSVIRGKTVRLDAKNELCFTTNEDGTGIMRYQYDVPGVASYILSIKYQDCSTKRLLHVKPDFSTVKAVEYIQRYSDGDDMHVSIDGRVWSNNGSEFTRESHKEKYDDLWNTFAPLFDEVNKKLPSLLKGNFTEFKFQIAYIDNEKMLLPKLDNVTRGDFSKNMKYDTYIIENNSAQPSK